MLQNVYSLPDLIDLALTVPEPGIVNFSILHTILHTIVKELSLSDIRPWCHIENPLLRKTELTKSKLKEVENKRIISGQSTSEKKEHPSATRHTESKSDEGLYRTLESKSQVEDVHEKEQDVQETNKKESETDAAIQLPKSDKESPAHPYSAELTEDTEVEETKELQTIVKQDVAVQVEVERDKTDKDVLSPAEPAKKKKEGELETFIFEAKEEIPPPSGTKSTRAGDAWRYTNLNMRVEATEEGLHRLSNIVDIIADKIKKADQKRKAGFSSEELELLDERITELEEALARLAADHELLMELQRKLNEMLAEFEAIKALGSQIKQMQIDISMKADKEETLAALALKGDLELVNTKVDQIEFETAIEELGEAIGLFGIKFTKKMEEWDERAAEIWRGIDSKMSRDIFDAAIIKIESRLIALMYALRKLKKVVEDLLYPEASGVTRCILCRRPACISGLECIGIYDSPKRPLSDKSSGDEDANKVKKILDDAIAKKQKLEVPPYCESRDTIISIPYSSSTYRSHIEEKRDMEVPKIKLMPISTEKDASHSTKTSNVPKLPNIGRSESPLKPTKTKRLINMGKLKPKSRTQKAELVFTKKLLANIERNNEESQEERIKYTAVLQLESPKKRISRPSSPRSSPSSVEMSPDPEDALQSFAPARLIPDSLRRNILLRPSRQSEYSPNISLSPLQFDTASKKCSTGSKFSESQKER